MEVFEIKNIAVGMLISGILVTFPVLTSTFAYVFTMDGYMLAIFLAVLSVYLASKKKLGFLIGGIALALSMGIYQAYLPIAILLCIYKVCIILLTDKEKKEFQKGVEQERKQLLKLLLKKLNLSYEEMIELRINEWMSRNCDLLTEAEKKRFKYIRIS